MSKRNSRKAIGTAARLHPLIPVPDDPIPFPDAGLRRYVHHVRAKSANQAALLEALANFHVIAALGPAGTGKTYLAIAKAVEALEAGRVGASCCRAPRWRPARHRLPARRRRGQARALPAPALRRPLRPAVVKRVRALITEGAIEIAPVGFMRGRTLNNAFVVIDEAQNCTYVQLKMLLTRLGWHSTMVVTGDPDQSDLLPEFSGLNESPAAGGAGPTSPSSAWPTATSCATRWWRDAGGALTPPPARGRSRAERAGGGRPPP